jgi:hypothetical protein
VKFKVRWKRSLGEGFVSSHDGRWHISPLYMGTTRPQGYQCRDASGKYKTWSGDRISDLKFDVDIRMEMA